MATLFLGTKAPEGLPWTALCYLRFCRFLDWQHEPRVVGYWACSVVLTCCMHTLQRGARAGCQWRLIFTAHLLDIRPRTLVPIRHTLKNSYRYRHSMECHSGNDSDAAHSRGTWEGSEWTRASSSLSNCIPYPQQELEAATWRFRNDVRSDDRQ